MKKLTLILALCLALPAVAQDDLDKIKAMWPAPDVYATLASKADALANARAARSIIEKNAHPCLRLEVDGRTVTLQEGEEVIALDMLYQLEVRREREIKGLIKGIGANAAKEM